MSIATKTAGVVLAATALCGFASLASAANAATPTQPATTAHTAPDAGGSGGSRGCCTPAGSTSPTCPATRSQLDLGRRGEQLRRPRRRRLDPATGRGLPRTSK